MWLPELFNPQARYFYQLFSEDQPQSSAHRATMRPVGGVAYKMCTTGDNVDAQSLRCVIGFSPVPMARQAVWTVANRRRDQRAACPGQRGDSALNFCSCTAPQWHHTGTIIQQPSLQYSAVQKSACAKVKAPRVLAPYPASTPFSGPQILDCEPAGLTRAMWTQSVCMRAQNGQRSARSPAALMHTRSSLVGFPEVFSIGGQINGLAYSLLPSSALPRRLIGFSYP